VATGAKMETICTFFDTTLSVVLMIFALFIFLLIGYAKGFNSGKEVGYTQGFYKGRAITRQVK
jgi:lipopolysaccharide/colanic/teichoic acid biosynthesis glycosyltransferase